MNRAALPLQELALIESSETKVNYFHVLVLIEHYVLEFQVSVVNTLTVQVLDPRDKLREDKTRVVLRESSLRADVV